MPIPMTNKPTKKAIMEAKKAMIQDALTKSDKFVERAILALYERQTAEEQAYAMTEEDNGMGFNGQDAELLSSYAEWIKKSWKEEGKRLSDKQRAIARKKLPKYWAQLAEHAEQVGKAKAAAATVQGQLGI